MRGIARHAPTRLLAETTIGTMLAWIRVRVRAQSGLGFGLGFGLDNDRDDARLVVMMRPIVEMVMMVMPIVIIIPAGRSVSGAASGEDIRVD